MDTDPSDSCLHRVRGTKIFGLGVADIPVESLFVMNFSMIFAASSAGVYDPYATSHFQGHSLIATANIIHGIVRIVGYPLLAKIGDVGLSCVQEMQNTETHTPDQIAHRSSARLWRCRTEHGNGKCSVRCLSQCRNLFGTKRRIPNETALADATVVGRWHFRIVWRYLVDYH